MSRGNHLRSDRGQLALELMTILAIYMVVISALASQFMGHRNDRREETLKQRTVDEAERVAAAMNPYFAVGRLNKTITCDASMFTYSLREAEIGPVRFYVHVVYDTKMQYFGPYEAYAPLQFSPSSNPIVYERSIRMECDGKTMYLCIDTQDWRCGP
ncbi:MAG: hypothetical protein QF415_09070 [Candidatus Undinarchaeales archaeon]|nr:hypothetical protein [Candidatus Undinarchaeales archaeon]MDP7493236.1 hypothetical protein [Candidatus Undinarchaeales archaeon]